MDTIELKYVKPLTGKYNAGVYTCPECKEDLLDWTSKYGNVYKHIFGFADTPNGNMAMVECPKCFTKWYYHSRISEGKFNTYSYFKEYVKLGENVHYDS